MENSQVKARLIAPFPYAGGKSRIADLVWQYFGSPEIYIEPFFGSGAVLLARPDWPMQDLRVCELVNDKDGFVANFWRAVQHDPAGVIKAADIPINENEYHARHVNLRQRKVDLVARLEADPDYYDAALAGWWLYCLTLHIGNTGRFFDTGSWVVREGKLVQVGRRNLPPEEQRTAIDRSKPKIDTCEGIFKRKWANGVWQELMYQLAERLRRVRVLCGDWHRICSVPALLRSHVTRQDAIAGIFLDPPYHWQGRSCQMYEDDGNEALTNAVIQYAIEAGKDPLARVAICGYADRMTMPDDWTMVTGHGFFGLQSQNRDKEARQRHAKQDTVWFSPYCLKPDTQSVTAKTAKKPVRNRKQTATESVMPLLF